MAGNQQTQTDHILLVMEIKKKKKKRLNLRAGLCSK